MTGPCLPLAFGEFCRLAEADDRRDVLGSAAQAFLLGTTVVQRPQVDPRAAYQCADALGPVELVARQAHQVSTERLEIQRHLAGCLHGVHMQPRARGADHRSGPRHILDDAGLVVGAHQRHQRDRAPLELPREGRPVDQPLPIDRHRLDGPLIAQRLGGFHDCRMLGRAVQHPPGMQCRHSLDRQVVRLGAARGPDHLAGLGADQRRDLHTCALDRIARRAPEAVQRRGIAVRPVQIREHRLEHARIDARGGVVIEIGRHRSDRVAAVCDETIHLNRGRLAPSCPPVRPLRHRLCRNPAVPDAQAQAPACGCPARARPCTCA